MGGPDLPDDRLDSWKAIADYLGRDVATARRWEKAQALPVRRVRGGAGRSVFAYRSELDAWLREPHTTVPETATPRWRLWATLGSAVALVLAGLGWRLSGAAQSATLAVEVTADGVVARGKDGTLRWRYEFPSEARTVLPKERLSAASVLEGSPGGVIVGTSHRLRLPDATVSSGELLRFTPGGTLERAFSLHDRIAFGTTSYEEPWAITDFRVEKRPDATRVVLAAHHFQWWPSVVSVLDERWQRRGTFVNAGWAERVQWLGPDRLVIAGFSNAKDGGMVALLDPNALDGQSPPSGDARYVCTSCGDASALRYVVLPRSELNRVTGSPFNRARVELSGERLVVQTAEVPENEARIVAAVYEFSRGLELQRASFGDRYWELHATLEAEGKLTHPRERCPDRDGPRAIEIWERATGWTLRATR